MLFVLAKYVVTQPRQHSLVIRQLVEQISLDACAHLCLLKWSTSSLRDLAMAPSCYHKQALCIRASSNGVFGQSSTLRGRFLKIIIPGNYIVAHLGGEIGGHGGRCEQEALTRASVRWQRNDAI